MEWQELLTVLGALSGAYGAALKVGWNAWQRERKDWSDERKEFQTERAILGQQKDAAVTAHMKDLKDFAQIAASSS